MKKIIAIFSLFITILSLTACNNNAKVEFNIAETKNIVLGNEVNSLVFTTKDGEQITYDTTADFYEIFDKIGFVNNEAGKKYSHIAETKLGDQSKSFVNMNAYYLDSAEFYEFRAKKEGDDAVAVVEEYGYRKQLQNNQFEMSTFCRYMYKDEKAFSGSESGTNGLVTYSSDKYPLVPDSNTELCEMQSRAVFSRDLVDSTSFFAQYEPFEQSNETVNFDEFINREYKLYENYIVFKQTAPFLNLVLDSVHTELFNNLVLNSNCSITQEAYCNVKTGEIELIKVYGNTIAHLPAYVGFKLEINMQIYIYDIDESDAKQKVDSLISYVKSSIN